MASRTSTRGGASPYRKGAAHERDVAGFLRELGALVVRSPQSGQAMDLTVLWRAHYDDHGQIDRRGWVPWLVQCKLAGYMRPAEREELIELARLHGCRPVMVGRKPFVFTDLTTGGQIEPPYSLHGTQAPRREVPS